jgi:Ser/Thr protein kinase RdoA (MazF antagonist)
MKELVTVIEQAYHIIGVTFSCLKYEEGYNEVYSMTTDDGKAYIVKIHRDQFVDANRLWQQQHFKVFLERAGLQTMPYRLTTENNPYCVFEKNLLTVEDQCKMFKVPTVTIQKIKAIGRMLGTVHMLSGRFESEMLSGSQWRIFGSNLTNTLYDYDAISRKIERLTERLPEHLSAYHAVRNQLRGIWDHLPEGIVHGDFGIYNLAFNSAEEVVGIVDFNLMGREKYVNELIQTAVLNVYIVSERPFEWKEGFAYLSAFIRAYRLERKLNAMEIEALPLIFRLCFLAYFGEKMPDVIITTLLEGGYDAAVAIET